MHLDVGLSRRLITEGWGCACYDENNGNFPGTRQQCPLVHDLLAAVTLDC